MSRLPLRLLLLALTACEDAVEDVCSHRAEETCDGSLCVFERSTGVCLQRCSAEDPGCPEGSTCELDSPVSTCPPEGGCLGMLIHYDVCREDVESLGTE
ncbi:MAG: hypothetical protein HOV80_21735 [Polyangiaceae bacterium]|nr:hypothetical protein [Polyangiaceae bacterium]